MSISGSTIDFLIKNKDLVIEPYVESKTLFDTSMVKASSLSYGLTHAGYDIRLSKLRLPNLSIRDQLDSFITRHEQDYETQVEAIKTTSLPYTVKKTAYEALELAYFRLSAEAINEARNSMWQDEVSYGILMPGQFCLGSTIERFRLPNNIDATLKDKSSNIRLGIQIQNTVLEPGWQGYLTLEISNCSHLPVYLEHGMPIGQLQFTFTDAPCVPYTGKYNNAEDHPQPSL